MESHTSKSFSSRIYNTYSSRIVAGRSKAIGNDEFGTETEADRQLKILLEKQLEKNITLQRQRERQRTFTSLGPYQPFTEEVRGTRSLQDFLLAKKDKEYQEKLKQLSGVIRDHKVHRKDSGTAKKLSTVANLGNEEQTTARHHQPETQLDTHGHMPFCGSRILTRHEMDIEKSLYAGCKQKDHLKGMLVMSTTPEQLHPLDPFSSVQALSKKLSKLRKRKYKSKEDTTTQDMALPSEPKERPDPTRFHAVISLDATEVQQNRLTVEQIRQIPRFKNYDPGIPSKALYLKNLHLSVDERILVALFSRFETNEGGTAVSYRLLTGRMRGQAFVTFPDAETAKAAWEYANGYLIRGKPIVIAYGRSK